MRFIDRFQNSFDPSIINKYLLFSGHDLQWMIMDKNIKFTSSAH